MNKPRITIISLLLVFSQVAIIFAQSPQNKLATKAGTLTLTGLNQQGQLLTAISDYSTFVVDFSNGTFASKLNLETFAGNGSYVDSLLLQIGADSLVYLTGTLNSPDFDPEAEQIQDFDVTGEMRYAGGVVSFDGELRFRSLNTTYPFYLFTGELALFPDKKLMTDLIPGLISPMHLSISQTLFRE